MKRITLIALLAAFCFFGSGIAQTDAIRGKIDMNLPNAPTPTVEVNLNQSFFSLFIKFTMNLPALSEYAEMIEGVFIRSYDKEADDITKLKNHFQKTLNTEKWEHIVRVKDQVSVSLLFTDKPGVINGIFIAFTDDHDTTFVNIFGNIDFQKLGILFGKIIESRPEFLKDIKFDGKFGSKK